MFYKWIEGMYVWAKTDNIYWPSITFDTADYIIQKPRQGQIYVYWFGDKRISMVQKSALQHFQFNFNEVYKSQKNIMGAKWKEGVCAAIKEYGKPVTSEMADDELIQFALDGFQGLTQDENDVEALCRKLPSFVKLVLISRKYVEWKRIDRPKNVGNLKMFSTLKEMINSLCIACYCYKPQYDHPLYEGKVCYDCYDKLKNTINVLDDEGLYIFCFICGNSSKVHSCIQQNCQRIYCTPCIQNLMKKKKIGKYLECNLCAPSNENTIVRKTDWLYQMQIFFHPEIKTVHLRTMYDVKRVMFIVCDNLHGFEKIFPHYHKIPFKTIEKGIFGLYSCRENSSFPDYRIFWDMFQEKDDFTLNDYCSVNMDKINELGPIDLLMGGLSLNVQNNYGEDFQLKIFLEFFRLLQIYKHFTNLKLKYWLFEISCIVSHDVRKEISKFLESEPYLFRHASATMFNLLWTNIDFEKL